MDLKMKYLIINNNNIDKNNLLTSSEYSNEYKSEWENGKNAYPKDKYEEFRSLL